MKEYRVVCDREERNPVVFGKEGRTLIGVSCKLGTGATMRGVYKTREDAEKNLEFAKLSCKEQDEKSERYAKAYKDWCVTRQYNFRIQSREVTEWAEA